MTSHLKTVILTAFVISLALSCGRRNNQTNDKVIEFTPDSLELKYAPSIKLGSDAPDFKIKDLEGKDITIGDFRGKYLILDFWASWCGDCRREIPEMKKVYERFASKTPSGAELEFLSISFDHEADKWKDMVESSGMCWPQGSNLIKWKENAISAAYGIHWIPTIIIVGPDGKVISYALTAEKLAERLETL